MSEREKPTWRERDRKKDTSAHRRDESAPRGAPARVATATAQYKRQLDALFDRGEVPDHLKDKLPAPDATGGDPESKERVRLTRAVRQAPSGPELVKALDALREKLGAVPEDLELVLRFLEHPKDAVLAEALGRPLVSTTAHKPGQATPYVDPREILDDFPGVELGLDGGPGGVVGTTVVDLTTSPVEVVRDGLGILDEFI